MEVGATRDEFANACADKWKRLLGDVPEEHSPALALLIEATVLGMKTGLVPVGNPIKIPVVAEAIRRAPKVVMCDCGAPTVEVPCPACKDNQ